MAMTINPAVSRMSTFRWLLHLGSFVLGVAVGATLAFVAVVTLAAGLQAGGGRAAWAVVACLVIALAIARDLGIQTPVPYRDVQVPQVLRYLLPPSFVALSYGTHLGFGFLTRFTYSSHAAFMLALPLFVRDPLVVAAAILFFAAGKAVVVVAFHGQTGEQITEIRDRHPTWGTRGRQGIRLANALVSALIIVTALRVGGVM